MAAKSLGGTMAPRIIHSKFEGSPLKLVAISLCALAGAFNFGITIGYSSSSIPSMIRRGVLTKAEGSWFGSLLTIGALVGGPLGGWCIEKFGRKLSITFLSIPFAAGFFIISSATETFHCYLGRFCTGIGSGMVTVCVPIYIAEIATTSMRGVLGASVQLMITIGIAITYILGMFLEWRFLSTVCVVPCVLGGFLTFFMPETPRWLLMKNRKTEAIKALQALRDPHANVQEECKELEDGADPEENVSFREIVRKRELSYPLFVCVCIMIYQQLSGINPVMFYTVSIFESAVGEFAYTATVIIGIVQVFGTITSVLLIDKMGRRKLLHFGGLIMAVTLFFFGLYYKLSASGMMGDVMNRWFPVFCLTVYIIGFSLGWGPIPMLIMSETIPKKCKGVAGSVAIIASWGSAFLVTSQFTTMQDMLGNSGIFYFFSFCCVLAIWFVAKYVPETKGKSLEDIELFFAGKSTMLV
ncbi:solute carrier family 2, facilitated glucose transporter member 8 [Plakobranchus ocellatus]|uniref:Solute carrier family 2, facilitated glucose transporter member 8 n=1 Tax=Plakobranchus ocellatus TaxID=259542 RepID=A0AAV4DVQ4_9GAST|nr:solute carrier family 2, facilitated glucose transporter member 8 [Plakobranchus ocellatus]